MINSGQLLCFILLFHISAKVMNTEMQIKTKYCVWLWCKASISATMLHQVSDQYMVKFAKRCGSIPMEAQLWVCYVLM